MVLSIRAVRAKHQVQSVGSGTINTMKPASLLEPKPSDGGEVRPTDRAVAKQPGCFMNHHKRALLLMNFEETIKLCKEYNFNEQITQEILWNTAYLLGRSRWYWGPMWWVDFTCKWKSNISNLFRRKPL